MFKTKERIDEFDQAEINGDHYVVVSTRGIESEDLNGKYRRGWKLHSCVATDNNVNTTKNTRVTMIFERMP